MARAQFFYWALFFCCCFRLCFDWLRREILLLFLRGNVINNWKRFRFVSFADEKIIKLCRAIKKMVLWFIVVKNFPICIALDPTWHPFPITALRNRSLSFLFFSLNCPMKVGRKSDRPVVVESNSNEKNNFRTAMRPTHWSDKKLI